MKNLASNRIFTGFLVFEFILPLSALHKMAKIESEKRNLEHKAMGQNYNPKKEQRFFFK